MGCRSKAPTSDLLRVVAIGHGPGGSLVELVPDPRHRLPGRGAYLHPDPRCLELAQRRKAFVKALRLDGTPPDDLLREHLAAQE